jgi:hypothetical protein
MKTFLNPLFVVLLFVAVSAGDTAISAAIARNTIRAICYGIVALLALIVIIITLLGA